MEKAKEASIIGILVGTLAVAGLQPAMARLRQLVREAGKKSFTMLMGKPNPAKLELGWGVGVGCVGCVDLRLRKG